MTMKSTRGGMYFRPSRRAIPWVVTADFACVRGHGPGMRYKGGYGRRVL